MQSTTTTSRRDKYFHVTEKLPPLSPIEGTEACGYEGNFYGGTGIADLSIHPGRTQEIGEINSSIAELIKDRAKIKSQTSEEGTIPSYLLPYLSDGRKFLEFCYSNNLFPSLGKTFLLIKRHFQGLKDIAIEYVEDPEIPNYSQICFTITLSNDSIESILAAETEYYKEFVKSIPIEHQQYIVISYALV